MRKRKTFCKINNCTKKSCTECLLKMIDECNNKKSECTSADLMPGIPKKLLTPEICLAAIRQDCGAFKFIPKKFKTLELCLEAVKIDSWLLQYVPKKFRTKQMYTEAIKNKLLEDRIHEPNIIDWPIWGIAGYYGERLEKFPKNIKKEVVREIRSRAKLENKSW